MQQLSYTPGATPGTTGTSVPGRCYSTGTSVGATAAELCPVGYTLQTGTRIFPDILPEPVAGHPFLQSHVPWYCGYPGAGVTGQRMY